MFDANHRHQSHAGDDAANAERALSSYYAAVAQQCGLEQAKKAAQDWIEELQKSCVERRVDWCSVIIAGARRRAHRVVRQKPDTRILSASIPLVIFPVDGKTSVFISGDAG